MRFALCEGLWLQSATITIFTVLPHPQPVGARPSAPVPSSEERGLHEYPDCLSQLPHDL
jgi:hypothetical protein